MKILTKIWPHYSHITSLLPLRWSPRWSEWHSKSSAVRSLPNVFSLISWVHSPPSSKNSHTTKYCVNSFHAFSQLVFTSFLNCYSISHLCMLTMVFPPPGIPFLLWPANCISAFKSQLKNLLWEALLTFSERANHFLSSTLIITHTIQLKSTHSVSF